MGVVGRAMVVFVAGWLPLAVHYVTFWLPVSIVMARTTDGDVEGVSATIASMLAVAAVALEVVLLARHRPGLLARWLRPTVVAGLIVAVLTATVLTWEHVYPCSAC